MLETFFSGESISYDAVVVDGRERSKVGSDLDPIRRWYL